MADTYQDISGGGRGEPATHVFTISPDDVSDLPYLPRAIWVGVGGSITLMSVGGTIGVITGIVAGTIVPVRARKVYATGTSAAGLVALV